MAEALIKVTGAGFLAAMEDAGIQATINRAELHPGATHLRDIEEFCEHVKTRARRYEVEGESGVSLMNVALNDELEELRMLHPGAIGGL
jgi:hypothetical protein